MNTSCLVWFNFISLLFFLCLFVCDVCDIDRQRCIEAGMTFLSKPFVRDDLFKLLDSLLAGINRSSSSQVDISTKSDASSLSTPIPPNGGAPSHPMTTTPIIVNRFSHTRAASNDSNGNDSGNSNTNSPMTTLSSISMMSMEDSQASSSAHSSTSSISRTL
jgi:hypothetical protein